MWQNNVIVLQVSEANSLKGLGVGGELTLVMWEMIESVRLMAEGPMHKYYTLVDKTASLKV